MKRIILASASPRRVALLQMMGLPFEQIVGGGSEAIDDVEGPVNRVRILSRRKAEEVASSLSSGLVIGADTVVAIDEKILEKPKDDEDAFGMLSRLSGRTHVAITGLTLVDAQTLRSLTDVVGTRVSMREMSPFEIRSYVATGEPMDKAGAYAAQGLGSSFVKHIEGCFHNVVGLPVERLCSMLKQMDCNIWEMRRDGAPTRRDA